MAIIGTHGEGELLLGAWWEHVRLYNLFPSKVHIVVILQSACILTQNGDKSLLSLPLG